MKTAKSLLIKFCAAAAMLLLANQSHALTTPYLTQLSNEVAYYHGLLSASPLPEHQKEARALARGLRDLSKPTATVAQDYQLYFLAVLHLGQYAFTDTNLTGAGVVAFLQFMNDAGAKIGELSARTNALNEFVPTRKAASKQIDLALALLITNATETNLQAGLLRGLRIFSKLVTAEKLVIKGEANQGFAPDDVNLSGGTLEYTQRDEDGTINFTDDTNYIQTTIVETTAGTYSYARTGLNTATIVLTEIGGSTTTVKTTFTSAGAGRYSLRFVGPSESGRSAGRFTFSRP